jgi:hypothetical protein
METELHGTGSVTRRSPVKTAHSEESVGAEISAECVK